MERLITYRSLQQRQMINRLNQIKENGVKEEIVNVPNANYECTLCCNRMIDVVVDCGHFMACSRCIFRLTHCTLCRMKIRNIIKVYFL